MVYLDAPVSGGPEGAAKGTLSIMVGGKLTTQSFLKFGLMDSSVTFLVGSVFMGV